MEFHSDGYGSFGGMVFENLDLEEADLAIVGIPYESATSGKKGASLGPAALRQISTDMQTMSRDSIDLNDMVLTDLGNIPVYPIEGKQTRDSIESTYDSLFTMANTPILTLGGDHSNTYPILKALAKTGTVGIIWFDAHRDVLSELMGSRWSHGSPLRRALELDNIRSEHVLLVGTRYMEPSEEEFVDSTAISELKMVDLETNEYDISTYEEHITRISAAVDHLYVSVDIDVLDPSFAPATGTPVAGGMTTAQLMRYIRAIPTPFRAIDIMEVAPPHDHAEITLKATMGLITEILAQVKTVSS